jgi:hypothetical protein
MKLYDKFELLAGYGKFPVVVLGNLTTREFELIDLERMPLEPSLAESYRARALGFMGTFALLDGEGRAEFAVSLDADLINQLADAYALLVTEKKREQEHAVSTSWLKQLWSLVDPRVVN